MAVDVVTEVCLSFNFKWLTLFSCMKAGFQIRGSSMNFVIFSILAVIWGCSFIAIKFSIAVLPPFFAAGMRVFIGVMPPLVIALYRRSDWPRTRALWGHALGLGMVSMGLPWALLFWGEQYVSSALASILNSTVPIFVAVLAVFFLRGQEHSNWIKISGVALGFAGVLVIFAPDLSFSNFTQNNMSLFGMGAIMLMSVSYAVNFIWLKRVQHLMDWFVLLSLQGISATAFLFTLSMLFETIDVQSLLQHPGFTKAVASLFYLGLLSTFLGWLLAMVLLKRLGALGAGAVTYAAPLVAIFADWFYYGTWPTSPQLIGAALIFFGLALINWLSRYGMVKGLDRKTNTSKSRAA